MLTRTTTTGLAALLCVGLLVTACGDETSDAVRVTSAADGSTVELAANGTLIVSLEGNPTTGYTWEIDDLDEAVLRSTGEPDYVSDSDAIGSGGTMTFEFEAVAAGETTLQLVYHRPWETDVDPIETFTVTVTVG